MVRFVLIQKEVKFKFESESSTNSTRLEILEHNWTRFQDGHETISLSEASSSKSDEYMKLQMYERCQELYATARAKLLTQRDELEQSIPTTNSVASNNTATTTMSRRLGSLPKITLPRFSDKLQEWRSFHDLFTSLIRTRRFQTSRKCIISELHSKGKLLDSFLACQCPVTVFR